MKTWIMGTSALVTAALAAGEAGAASGLKLGITGFYRNAIGGSFGNSPTSQHVVTSGGAATSVSTAGLGNFDRQAVSMRQQIRVNFTGKTTLDNGMTVGVLVGLDGENVAKSDSTSQINRAYGFFNGKFGEVRVGEAYSALVTDCILDPGNVTSNFGVNSPEESFSNVGFAQRRNQFLKTAIASNSPASYFSTFGVAPMGSIGTCFGIESKGNKIEYFSPDISGLSFGVSFAPTGGQRRAGGGLSYGTDVTAPGSGDTGNNILSVAADYAHDFDGIEVTLGGGAEWAFTQYTPAGGTTGNKPAWYQGGLQIDFGHFAVGFSGAYYQNYLHDDYSAANTASPSDDGWVVAVGGATPSTLGPSASRVSMGAFNKAPRSSSVPRRPVSARITKICGVYLSTPPMRWDPEFHWKARSPTRTPTTAASPAWAFRCRSLRPWASMPVGSTPGRSIWAPGSISSGRVCGFAELERRFSGAGGGIGSRQILLVSSRMAASILGSVTIRDSRAAAAPARRHASAVLWDGAGWHFPASRPAVR